jgi:hypothetical protein
VAVAAGCGREGFDPNACSDAHAEPDVSTAQYNIAFVTSTKHLPTAIGTDLSGGDAICMQRAAAAGLPGTFRVFASITSLGAHERLAGARGWVRTDGAPLVDLIDDFNGGKVFYPLALDEFGAQAPGAFAATGSYSTGEVAAGNNCADFADGTSASSTIVGDPGATLTDSINGGTAACNLDLRLYCFQIDKSAALAFGKQTGRLAFVTTQPYIVDAGGMATADNLCNSEAALAGFPQDFKAVLATSTAGALSRFDLTGAKWVRPDGVPIATSPLGVASPGLVAPINQTVTGTYVGGSVTTGVETTITQPSTMTCSDWIQPGGITYIGYADYTYAAFAGGGTKLGCTTQPVYCLEQ